ncbi:MAG TPA: hypothetical protein VIW23_00045 [Candidatus Acidoferrum sp.]
MTCNAMTTQERIELMQAQIRVVPEIVRISVRISNVAGIGDKSG